MTNKTIHFIDLDGTLISTGAMWWIIDKNTPDTYLCRITQQESSLILGGFYKHDEHAINYNGMDGWLSTVLWNKIQRIKRLKSEDIGISWREYADHDHIDKQSVNLVVHLHRVAHLKNSTDVINLLTARNNRNAHTLLLLQLNDELSKLNIKINDAIFVNDSSIVRHVGTTAEKKMICILENIVGHKIEDNAFMPILVEKYDVSHFYDDDDMNIAQCRVINRYLKECIDKTQPWLKQQITEHVNMRKPKLFLHMVNTNELNPFDTEEILITITK